MSRVYTHYDLVEGEYYDFVFKRILKEDYPRVLEHFRKYFLTEEPTCILLGYSKLFYEQMDIIVTALMEHNLSFLVEHKQTKELAAIRITFRETKETLKAFEDLLDHTKLDPRTDVMLNGTDMPDEVRDELYANWNIDEYAEFFAVSTVPKFRNKGLSSELYKRSFDFLRAEGFKIVTCIFTSPITRRSAEKLGFQEFYKINYKDMKDANGNNFFKSQDLEKEHHCVAMLKAL